MARPPAKIRLNVQASFPALVVGSGGITVTKKNGIWTIGGGAAASSGISAPTLVTVPGVFTLLASQFGDILVNVNGAVTVQLPAASTRFLQPVSVVDIGGFAQANPITVLPFGAETIAGLASALIGTNMGALNLWPISSGNWYLK